MDIEKENALPDGSEATNFERMDDKMSKKYLRVLTLMLSLLMMVSLCATSVFADELLGSLEGHTQDEAASAVATETVSAAAGISPLILVGALVAVAAVAVVIFVRRKNRT